MTTFAHACVERIRSYVQLLNALLFSRRGAIKLEMRWPGKKTEENVDNKRSGLFETRVLMRIRSLACTKGGSWFFLFARLFSAGLDKD